MHYLYVYHSTTFDSPIQTIIQQTGAPENKHHTAGMRTENIPGSDSPSQGIQ